MKDLILVESPTKAKTIKKIVGNDFDVIATKGHIRDLPKSSLGVEVKDKTFLPEYEVIKGKASVIKDLKASMKGKHAVILASDPDREGEAIAWHTGIVLGLLNNKGKENPKKAIEVKRIVFHEITKDAILEALSHPRGINLDLVDAQQARRILDRIVGYKLSPLLWSKIRYGLSAGRVQSVAVRLIVDREAERDAFIAEEYWSIDALFTSLTNNESCRAELVKLEGKGFKLTSEDASKQIVDVLNNSNFSVSEIKTDQIQKKPYAPFTTSSLQQEANKKLNYSGKRTMIIAQQLYEGVNVNGNSTGLITYMRTDSVTLSQFAMENIKGYIQKTLGESYLPEKGNAYKNTSKSAQEAHEAIRPTDITLTPEKVKPLLKEEQYKLYTLIWKRAVASQMRNALYERREIFVEGKGEKNSLFRAAGQKRIFDGFQRIYDYGKDEDVLLEIDVQPQDKLSISDINPQQHFTQPPARYTEASLIKALEKMGIGRPSTYVPIISTIQARGYVTLENKYFIPTDNGEVVNALLVKHFPEIVDTDFTSKLEQQLDEVATGKQQMNSVLSQFYFPFEDLLVKKSKEIRKEDIVVMEESDEKCPICGAPMVVKLGKYGKFLSCSNFPDCKGMKSLEGDEGKLDEEKYESLGKCEKCGGNMELKRGKFGAFQGCENYPKCKNVKPLYLKVHCPQCGNSLIERRGRGGKPFYGCSHYPDCKYIANSLPNKESEAQP